MMKTAALAGAVYEMRCGICLLEGRGGGEVYKYAKLGTSVLEKCKAIPDNNTDAYPTWNQDRRFNKRAVVGYVHFYLDAIKSESEDFLSRCQSYFQKK